MEMNKRTKALSISKAVKEAVYERDNRVCVLCGSPQGAPVAHIVRRSQGGLGIEQNIVTLCSSCHRAFDEGANISKFGKGTTRESLYCHLVAYLKQFYPDWNREDMIYRKGEHE
jgi:hypothetical protein